MIDMETSTAAIDLGRKPYAQPSCYLTGELWEKLEPLLPPEQTRSPRGGRPPKDRRLIANAIFFLLRTGAQWNAITVETFGVGKSTAHEHFQLWVEAGVFQRFWVAGLLEYNQGRRIPWDFQSLDGSMVKAPLGGISPDPIRPIVASSASNARFSPTVTASP